MFLTSFITRTILHSYDFYSFSVLSLSYLTFICFRQFVVEICILLLSVRFYLLNCLLSIGKQWGNCCFCLTCRLFFNLMDILTLNKINKMLLHCVVRFLNSWVNKKRKKNTQPFVYVRVCVNEQSRPIGFDMSQLVIAPNIRVIHFSSLEC